MKELSIQKGQTNVKKKLLCVQNHQVLNCILIEDLHAPSIHATCTKVRSGGGILTNNHQKRNISTTSYTMNNP
jgi:hypothetical protein